MGQLGSARRPVTDRRARFFPPSTNADYNGGRSAALFLGLAAALTLIPGLIHSVLPDGGSQSIAGLDPGGRAALVRGVFAWEGSTQLALVVAILAVSARYQPRTPLCLRLIILERSLMTLQGRVIRPPVDGRHPPEPFASPIAAALASPFLILSLRPRRA